MRGTKAQVKAHAPESALRLNAWRRDVWSDLRLRLLVEVGHVPSHRLRNSCYRAAGVVRPESSSIHWCAQFYEPKRLVIGSHVIISDNPNMGSHVSILYT